MSLTQWIELLGAAMGLLGTLLLAGKGKRAGWGFVAFLASNVAWMVFASTYGHWGLFAQHAAFMLTSVWGIWRWLVQPWLEAVFDWEGS